MARYSSPVIDIKRAKNLERSRFGELTVVGPVYRKYSDIFWRCLCDCGKEVVVRGNSLKTGHTKSCGCLKEKHAIRMGNNNAKDITHNRFGRLLALYPTEERAIDGSIVWTCFCECGVICNVSKNYLETKRVRSCGCLQKESRIKHGLHGTSIYRQYTKIKRREKEKLFDSSWSLEMQQAARDFFSCCVICGEEENLALDHIDPLKYGNGLWIDNVVALCRSCNNSKKATQLTDLPANIRHKLLEGSWKFQEYWEALG